VSRVGALPALSAEGKGRVWGLDVDLAVVVSVLTVVALM